MEYCKRRFGKSLVTITKNGEIKIVGDFFTNYGLIYPKSIESFKAGEINSVTGFRYQVVGMDKQPSDTILKWIYSKIERGYFDHLIKEV